jgi:hypothetical protein
MYEQRKISLYHNRTHAVTEAYAMLGDICCN